MSGSLDKTVCLWDVNTQQLRHAFLHDDGVIKVLCHPTQAIVYSCSLDRSVGVWDMRSCELIRRFTGHREGILNMALLRCVQRVLDRSINRPSLTRTRLDPTVTAKGS